MAQAQTKPVTAPAPVRSRITLASVTKAVQRRPVRLLVHGQPGVGKTTFAADAPSPVFICPEDGIPESTGEVPRFPAPEDGWRWPDVQDAVTALTNEAHSYKTLVIDTLDWLEPLLWSWLCEQKSVSSIEDIGGGYGKGYGVALDLWRLLLSGIERMSKAKGMNVIMLAHSEIRPFKDPQSEGYDRYELKIHKLPAGLFKEWSDAVLFAQHEAIASTDKKTKRIRGVSTGARIMHTVWNAAFDAKNRFGLPEEMPLSYPELQAAIDAKAPASAVDLAAEIKRKAAEVGGEVETKALAAIDRADGDALKLSQLNDWVNGKLALSASQKGT